REERDASWLDIKSGRLPAAEAAAGVEGRIRIADDMADARHSKAQEAAELQNLQHKLEQDAHHLEDAKAVVDARQQALAEFDARWEALCAEAGLNGMPLAEMFDWSARKDKALEAARALEEARNDEEAMKAMH